jgi:hypothetical protein
MNPPSVAKGRTEPSERFDGSLKVATVHDARDEVTLLRGIGKLPHLIGSERPKEDSKIANTTAHPRSSTGKPLHVRRLARREFFQPLTDARKLALRDLAEITLRPGGQADVLQSRLRRSLARQKRRRPNE